MAVQETLVSQPSTTRGEGWPRAMTRPPRTALVGLVLLLFVGGWLVVAPFLLGDQPRGGPWRAVTRNDVAVGTVLVAADGVALFCYLVASLYWLARHAPRHTDELAHSGGTA